jgi:hypothetical protein
VADLRPRQSLSLNKNTRFKFKNRNKSQFYKEFYPFYIFKFETLTGLVDLTSPQAIGFGRPLPENGQKKS